MTTCAPLHLRIAGPKPVCSNATVTRPGTMTSTCILHQIAEGRPAGMHAFLERYSGLVWSLARRHSPTPQDAEDAVQEIFMEVWRSARRYDPAIAAEQTFVAMIARRRLIDRARRMQRQPKTEALSGADSVVADATPDRIEMGDEAARIIEVLRTLRPEQRQVLELSLVHGRSHSQISAQTGMPLGTVKSLARRGLMRIRRRLGVADQPGAGEVQP